MTHGELKRPDDALGVECAWPQRFLASRIAGPTRHPAIRRRNIRVGALLMTVLVMGAVGATLLAGGGDLGGNLPFTLPLGR